MPLLVAASNPGTRAKINCNSTSIKELKLANLVLALATSKTVEGKNRRAVANFLHRGVAQVVFEFKMTGQNNREGASAIFHHLNQVLESGQSATVKLVGFIHKKSYGFLPL